MRAREVRARLDSSDSPGRLTFRLYVDLFSFSGPDFRAELAAGKIGGLAVDGPFLLGTTAYALIQA